MTYLDEDGEEILAEAKLFALITTPAPDDPIPGLTLVLEGPGEVRLKFSGMLTMINTNKTGGVAIFHEGVVCGSVVVDSLFKTTKWSRFWGKVLGRRKNQDVKYIKFNQPVQLDQRQHVFTAKMYNLEMVRQLIPMELRATRVQ